MAEYGIQLAPELGAVVLVVVGNETATVSQKKL